MLAKITTLRHIKITHNTPHRYSEDTPDIPLSNSNIKKQSIFIKPFLIDFLTLTV
jgi:hypothetical protein